jgi:hypothetical protein
MSQGVKVYRNVNLVLAPGVQTAVPFTGAYWEDTPSYWDISVPTRIVIPAPGRYHVFGAVAFNVANYAFADVFAKLNGTFPVARDKREIDIGNSHLTFHEIVEFVANDYLELIVWTNSYQTTTVFYSPNSAPNFGVELIP